MARGDVKGNMEKFTWQKPDGAVDKQIGGRGMKYSRELYIDSQIFAGDMDGLESNFSEKIVKTRKPHECCVCGKEILKGTEMVMQSAIIEGERRRNCYICLSCIEEWLEESGQVGDDEEHD